MSFLEAAEKVIREANRPLTPTEIWERGKNYIDTKGKTPWNTLNYALHNDVENNPETKFEIKSSKPDKFYLKELPGERIETELRAEMGGKNTGYIYILENEAMKGLCKIGSSGRRDIDKRIRELYSTNVPFPFKCVFSCEVENYKDVEKFIHDALHKSRVNPQREFFEIEPKRIIPLLEHLRIKNATKSINEKINETIDAIDKQADKKYAKKSPQFKFKEMGIDIGETISFIRDESIKAKVIEGNSVEHGGEEYSLTELTSEFLGYTAASLPYWKHKNKPLSEYYYETYSKFKHQSNSSMESLYNEVFKYIELLCGRNISFEECEVYWSFKKSDNYFIGLHKYRPKDILMQLKLDPKTVKLEYEFTRDMSKIKGKFAPGDLEVRIKSKEDFEKAKPLIERAYKEN